MKLKNMLLTVAAAVLVGCAPVQPASQQQESSQIQHLKLGILNSQPELTQQKIGKAGIRFVLGLEKHCFV